MKRVFSGFVVLAMLFGGYQSADVKGGQRNRSAVPNGFSYPQSPSTTSIETPMYAKALLGTVSESSGSNIPNALVEIVSEDRATRLGARFTDDDGSFSFAKAAAGRHYLKVSMPGFDTLLVTVIVSRKSRARLTLVLKPST